MASLSRTTSQNSVGSSKTAQFTAAPTERGPMPPDTPHPQNSPAATNTRPAPPPRSRTSSHTLLSSNLNPQATSRKSRFVDAGTTPGTSDRASISMPPPASHRQPTSRQQSALAMELEPAKDDNSSVGKVGRRVLDGSVVVHDQDKMPDIQTLPASEPCSPLAPDSTLKLPSSSAVSDPEGNRLSLTSLYSLGSAIYNGAVGSQSAPPSAASSNAGSVKSGSFDPTAAPLSPTRASIKSDLSASVTTATDPVSVTANDHTQAQLSLGTLKDATKPSSSQGLKTEQWGSEPLPRQPLAPRRSRSRTKRQASGSTAPSSTASPNNSERGSQVAKRAPIGRLGVCALDVKARSKASRNILTRLQSGGEFEIVVFGDKVILDEDVENWPLCDFLISFFSDGFPLDKAIAYAQLRKPFTINDIPMQKILWDRRICLRVLDCMGVPTPCRLEVSRDGGPRLESAELARHVRRLSGVILEGPEDGTGGGTPQSREVDLVDGSDTLVVDGKRLSKPFVEKPISGEDHNIRIYFPKTHESGGGGRKLFRKIGNKSSEWDSDMTIPRVLTEEGSSYIYEQFLHVNNAEDIKAYTVGRDFCHAETRKSPVVDGVVQRNTHGKEIRYVTKLNPDEQSMATRITDGFGQRVCGFDLLRVGGKSFVIDVNGWSFVKDNKEYYDDCAKILKEMCTREKQRSEGSVPPAEIQNDFVPEKSAPSRKSTTSHRATLKGLIKSPSMSKLASGHLLPHRSSNMTTPEMTKATASISSPPSIEHGSLPQQSSIPPLGRESLPPPAVSLAPSPESQSIMPEDPTAAPQPASKHAWKLKGMVSVIRHADRTPKQKFKFTFHTQPFVDLLKGHQEEVLLKGEAALNSVLCAVNRAMREGVEDPDKLKLLKTSLARKGAWTGTKVQIKPMFRKRKETEVDGHEAAGERSSTPTSLVAAERLTAEPESGALVPPKLQIRHDSLTGVTLSRFSAAENDLILDKLQLIIKWGGEPTHSARYQSQDLGENMRNDLLLMNKDILEDVRVFTSSERRVSTSAQIWAASFLDQKDIPEEYTKVRKDLLDDSNAAKDVMDKVKKKLKLLLREGHQAPPQFAWPPNTPEPSIVVGRVVELMNFHRQVMRDNFRKLPGGASAALSALKIADDGTPVPNTSGGGALARAEAIAKIQSRWCCGEDPELFKERWEKLFTEFCDSEKVDPSKLSELYDTMKFDALHNRNFLEWVFKPAEELVEEPKQALDAPVPRSGTESPLSRHERRGSGSGDTPGQTAGLTAYEKSTNNLAQRMGMGFRRKSVFNPPSPQPFSLEAYQESYFKLFVGSGQSKAKQDPRLEKLRELYKYAKVLFDFVCPQEYGIADSEKLEIGLLTSLPLLKEIVQDLEAVQASDEAKSFVYFTKESHIYTLLNCILEGGITTKIERNAIPELDYLSTITFELYESEDKDTETFAYSIRITITPGCHTFDPLDVHLDSKHSIGCAPRRSLTAHHDWREVIETLRAKFNTVKLPKSFLAVNVSDRHAGESEHVHQPEG
ncbi:inositol hexakisphosphate and diphosphoinositol-pentakisphosphate kinase [Xanthoria parietina]